MLFAISGYWKDDKSEFSEYIVTDSDCGMMDEDVFYYGLSETEIQDAIEKGEDTTLEFVITGYEKLNFGDTTKQFIMDTLVGHYLTVRTDKYGQVPINSLTPSIFGDRKDEVREYCSENGTLQFSTYGSRFGNYTAFIIEDREIKQACYNALSNNPFYLANVNSY